MRHLVAAGYPSELAYYETCNEMKLIMDLVYQYGFVGMLRRVSDTAKFGGLTVGHKVIDRKVRDNMKQVLTEIRDPEAFAKTWTGDREKKRSRTRPHDERTLEPSYRKSGQRDPKAVGP